MQMCLLTVLLVVAGSWSNLIVVERGYHEEVGIPLAYRINAAENRATRSRRAVGGELAPITAHPYLAGLIITLRNRRRSICSGSLLNHQVLVSAAHCWYDGKNQAQKYTVVLGSTLLFRGGLRIETSAVVVHPEWNVRGYMNDISIIHLPYKISFSDKIHPIALPSTQDSNKTFAGDWAMAAGYGWSMNDVSVWERAVNHVKLRVTTNQICRLYYRHVPWTNMCTIGRSAVCRGDSGGPLVIKKDDQDTLIGISSFTHTKGCQWGKPSGFTRVTAFLDFIYNHTSPDLYNETKL